MCANNEEGSCEAQKDNLSWMTMLYGYAKIRDITRLGLPGDHAMPGASQFLCTIPSFLAYERDVHAKEGLSIPEVAA
ncbi:hypothetical protein Syun_016742 [Stephania yunnanensis]|uniref:Uncharacterized protein n=1 Tax=Stephania yunnanensis TaxID=152371 RepID=A0AAP0P488_9MAGN